jgi:CRISPR system Cascade subunit CasA
MSRPSFDVLTRPWIPVTAHDGLPRELGILDALEQAPTLREIRDPSPIVEFGLYRLLVAFVLDALVLAGRRPEEPLDLRELLEEGAFEAKLFDRYVQTCGDVFDLFHPDRPFLQTAHPLKNDKSPVETLFLQLPSGNEAIHWHHGQGGALAVGAADLARALTTVAPFMKQGGRGYYPSINGTSPLYVMPVGHSLFDSLVLNLPTRTMGQEHVSAAWLQQIIPQGRKSPMSIVDGLTWQPRQIRLLAGPDEPPLVTEIVFQPGFGVDGSSWVDPNLAYQWSDQGPQKVPMRYGRPLWRDAGPLVLLSAESFRRGEDKISTTRPDVVECALTVLPQEEPVRLRAYGMRAKQANVFEWEVSEMIVPVALGRMARLGWVVNRELLRAESSATVLRGAILALSPEYKREEQKPPSARKKWTIRALRNVATRCERAYWTRLQPEFVPLLAAFAALNPDAPDDPALIDTTAAGWREAISTLAVDQFERAAKDMDADAGALERLVMARARLRGTLRKVLS